MTRFFIDKPLNKGDRTTLTGEDHIHLSVVLRLKAGETVTLCDSLGYDYTAVIESVSKKDAVLLITEKLKSVGEPKKKVTLFFACLKGDKNELVVQKAVELGVHKLVPIITEYVQVKPASVKPDRLNKIALSAARQSKRGIVPNVTEPIRFDALKELLKDFDAVVFPYEKESENRIRKCLPEILGRAQNVALIVGSEGGFSDAERDALMGLNIQPLTLGPRILRAETASIAVLSLVMYELGELAGL